MFLFLISSARRKVLVLEMGLTPFVLMVLEFEPAGDKVQHIVTGGKDNVGKVTEKQD